MNGKIVTSKIQIRNSIIDMICLFCILEPASLTKITEVHLVISIIRIIIGTFCLYLFFESKVIPKVLIGYIVICVTAFMSMLCNGAVMELAPEFVSVLMAVMYFTWLCKKNIYRLINSLYYLFWMYLCVNAIYMLLNPWTNEYDAYGFIGGKNAYGPIGLLVCLIGVFQYMYCEKKRKGAFALIVFSVVQNLWMSSAASLIGTACFLILLILLKFVSEDMKIFKILYLTRWAMFFLIIVWRVQNILIQFVSGLFGKEVTFSGRTRIWDKTFQYIQENWILGYGTQNVVGIKNGIDNTKFWAAHNGILDLLIIGGILLLIVYEIFTLYCAKHGEVFVGRYVQISSITWFSFQTMMLAEYLELSAYYFLICCFLYYIPKLEVDGRNRKDRNYCATK